MLISKEHTFAICAYKESPFLESCVNSIVSQSYKTNVIICTSTPNSRIDSVANHYGVPVLVRDGRSNMADDWNFAIDSAPTQLVTIAHQDDVYCPEYAQNILASFSKEEDALIFFSNYGEIREGEVVDENRLLAIKRRLLSPLKDSKKGASGFWKRNALRFGNSICCPSVTYNKERLPLPLFQKGLKNSLDWEAWERLSRDRGSFCYCPKVLMYHRIHEGSETTRLIADNTRTAEDLEMFKKFWPSPVAYFINAVYSKGQNSNAI